MGNMSLHNEAAVLKPHACTARQMGMATGMGTKEAHMDFSTFWYTAGREPPTSIWEWVAGDIVSHSQRKKVGQESATPAPLGPSRGVGFSALQPKIC